MKKLILFSSIAFALISCNNDDNTNNEPQNPSDNNQILKLKEFRALATSKYFYHENGFVDSISTTRLGNTPTNIESKLHYNSENRLTSMERWVDVSNTNETIYEKDLFEYNNENLIVIKKVYDENQNLKQTLNYTYNTDGNLDETGQVYANGNLVQDGNITYSYDNKKNPFFEMYPLAYIRMNQINKNNLTQTNNQTETLETINWMYNQNGYPISFQKSPVLPDDIDYAEYIYY